MFLYICWKLRKVSQTQGSVSKIDTKELLRFHKVLLGCPTLLVLEDWLLILSMVLGEGLLKLQRNLKWQSKSVEGYTANHNLHPDSTLEFVGQRPELSAATRTQYHRPEKSQKGAWFPRISSLVTACLNGFQVWCSRCQVFSILLLMAASGTQNPLGPNSAIGVGSLCHGSPNKELGFLKLLLCFISLLERCTLRHAWILLLWARL